MFRVVDVNLWLTGLEHRQRASTWRCSQSPSNRLKWFQGKYLLTSAKNSICAAGHGLAHAPQLMSVMAEREAGHQARWPRGISPISSLRDFAAHNASDPLRALSATPVMRTGTTAGWGQMHAWWSEYHAGAPPSEPESRGTNREPDAVPPRADIPRRVGHRRGGPEGSIKIVVSGGFRRQLIWGSADPKSRHFCTPESSAEHNAALGR